jgi:hypothetical protein
LNLSLVVPRLFGRLCGFANVGAWAGYGETTIKNEQFDTLSRRLLESNKEVQDWIRSLARMGKPDQAEHEAYPTPVPSKVCAVAV